jgi:hypothetical protein
MSEKPISEQLKTFFIGWQYGNGILYSVQCTQYVPVPQLCMVPVSTGIENEFCKLCTFLTINLQIFKDNDQWFSLQA